MENTRTKPLAVTFAADDGYRLGGFLWRHGAPAPAPRTIVVINAATAVKCRYYARFAAYLHEHGFDVLSYDYRGIGESRPPSLKGFEAGWIDWGRLDFDAALRHAAAVCTGQPVAVIGHSVGGFLVGLAASNHLIDRVFTVGAQFAYWPDYAAARRFQLYLKWHLFTPAVTALCGFFPGRRLGWLEDMPRGVVRDWTASRPRFEDNWRRGALVLPEHEIAELLARFAAVRADTLALSFSDDEFGTVTAVRRLLAYFSNSERIHLHLSPQALGVRAVGHFAFFHSRFAATLWPLALEWLQHGRLPAAMAGDAERFPRASSPASSS